MDLTRAEVENALKKRGYLATEPQALDVICRAAHAWLTLEARVRELEAAGQAFLKRYDELMPYEERVWDRLAAYYGNDVMSMVFAPLYPDASRNILWKLRRKGA